MKLVDILATELKAWPESFGAYCVASSHGSSGKTRYPVWFCVRKPYRGDGGWCDIGAVELTLDEGPEDQEYAIVTRPQWQAAVDALKAGEQSEEWSGLGMPPVGTVCEAKMPPQGLKLPGAEWIWRRVEVVRHNDGVRNAHRECLVFDLENTVPAWVDELRPIRTAEQIAAEERKVAIWKIACDCGYGHNEDHGYDVPPVFAAIYDAGYRKQATQPARKGGSNERPAD